MIWLYLGALFCLIIAGEAVVATRSWSDGDTGEWRVVRALRGLSDEYTLVRNWVIPGAEQGDIDLLVLGPHGVLVLEVKNYRAKYECDGDDWVNVKENGYRKRMKSPSRQLAKNSRAVQSFLVKSGWQGTVHSALVIPPRADVRIAGASVTILDWKALPQHIRALPSHGTPVSVSLFRG